MFSVAMSLDTGAIVFLRDGKVIGSMARDKSVEFCQNLVDWSPPETLVDEAVAEAIKPKLTVVQ
jgi:hypothetical protein